MATCLDDAAFSYEVIMRNLNGPGIVLLQNSVECGFTFFGMKAFRRS